MNRFQIGRALGLLLASLVMAGAIGIPSAWAYPFGRTLQEGDHGWDVQALKVRLAGWYPSQDQSRLRIDKRFTGRTTAALEAFQSFYGVSPDGVAGADTFAILNNLQDPDGSTVNFGWAQFKQNSNPSCSAKANADAGTFNGGMVAPALVRRYVRRLMWRLEALRAKGGGHLIGIESGFRGVAYNACIGGASASQHTYGTAVDQRMAGVGNHHERRLGESSDFSGIGCYAQLTHNHFDIRMENHFLASSQFWWWPQQNGQGQDLDEHNKPCFGETGRTASPSKAAPWMADILTKAQVRAFAAAGEAAHLGYGD